MDEHQHYGEEDASVTGQDEDDVYEDDDLSDEYEEGIDEEPVGEGELPPPPKLQPSYKKANEEKFYSLCRKLEMVWQASHKKKKKKIPDFEKLNQILPVNILHALDKAGEENNQQPESIYPIYRLLMPDKDTSRRFRIAEKVLAQMYGGALGLTKTSVRYKMLQDYGDPRLAGGSAGDFPSVVGDVVGKYKPASHKGSSFTIGDINAALDKFVSLSAQSKASNHEFKTGDKKKKGPKLIDLRTAWLEDLNRDDAHRGRLGLSPVEHKWLVRILINQMRIGVGFGKLLEWYDPLAKQLWSSHNSLKAVLDKMCDPAFAEERKRLDRKLKNASQEEGLQSYLPKSIASPEFGSPFCPMFSVRTAFDRTLFDLSKRHREWLRDKGEQYPHVPPDSLAFKHPAFSIETKLDGERQLVHISRDGIVKLHTRNKNWYR